MKSISALLAAVVVSSAVVGTGAAAQNTPATTLTLAGLRTIQFLPVQYAFKQGYFTREGLEVNLVVLNSGPAVISAVVSGSAQIGYASPVPIVFARAQSQPVKMFDALTMTSSDSKVQWNSLVASEKSGIRSLKDLAGKTVALNTMGGACELQFREHMALAGVAFESVKKIVVPFPQMQAALQLGNADAACPVDPFRVSMRVSPDVKAVVLSSGSLASSGGQYPEDILFVRDDWGSANKDALRRFNRAVSLALADFKKDPKLLRKLLVDELKLSAAVASLLDTNIEFANAPLTAANVKPIVDALARHQMLKANVDPADTILPLQ